MQSYLIVFLGAGLGGALRHAVNVGSVRFVGGGLPVATALVNITGSFALGLLAGYFALRADPGQHWRLFLTTGVLGGFTTFSAFSLDVALLYERGDGVAAATYVAGTVAGALLGVLAGLVVMRRLAGA